MWVSKIFPKVYILKDTAILGLKHEEAAMSVVCHQPENCHHSPRHFIRKAKEHPVNVFGLIYLKFYGKSGGNSGTVWTKGVRICRTGVRCTIEARRAEVGVGRADRRPHLKRMEMVHRGAGNSIQSLNA